MRLASLYTIAVGGVFAATAATAAVTQVNIQDPNATSRVAKVEVGNRLAVQEVSPSTFYHSSTYHLNSGAGCVIIATPPPGKALIIRQVRVDVYDIQSSGPSQNVPFFADAGCIEQVGDINPPTVGQFTATFDPGLAIPNGSVLAAVVNGGVAAEVYVDGYKVDSSVVPQAGGQTIEVHGKARQ